MTHVSPEPFIVPWPIVSHAICFSVVPAQDWQQGQDAQAAAVSPGTTRCNSYKFLMFPQEEIFGALLGMLQKPGCLCLDALLDLVVQLSHDLQDDFYAKFPAIFSVCFSNN